MAGRKSRLSLTTIQKVVGLVRESRKVVRKTTMVWHAGEPLVLAIDFYRAAHNAFSERARETGMYLGFRKLSQFMLLPGMRYTHGKRRRCSAGARNSRPAWW